jgi:predicted DNA-binding protein (UPF0251 family)
MPCLAQAVVESIPAARAKKRYTQESKEQRHMARGWESKSIADQMEEQDKSVFAPAAPHENSPVVRARHERLESLRLSRSRTLAQLERATRQAHRDMLKRTLRALETEIEELS